jgi:hypothetical protein
VQVVHPGSARTIRFEHFLAEFHDDNVLLPLSVPVQNCVFRVPGEYVFEVWFATIDWQAVQKAELPLFLLEDED